MHFGKSNHASCRAEPCTFASAWFRSHGDGRKIAGSDPARCAFSVGLEFGDTPCAIAPMMSAYAKASAFADATAAALCAMAVKTADKSAQQAGR